MSKDKIKKLLDQAYEFGNRDTAKYVYEEWRDKELE